MDCNFGVVGGVDVAFVAIVVHFGYVVTDVIADIVGQVGGIIGTGVCESDETNAAVAGNGYKRCD